MNKIGFMVADGYMRYHRSRCCLYLLSNFSNINMLVANQSKKKKGLKVSLKHFINKRYRYASGEAVHVGEINPVILTE